jgi:hypothetical protein
MTSNIAVEGLVATGPGEVAVAGCCEDGDEPLVVAVKWNVHLVL